MNAHQTLQEYADDSGNRLTVDRARGVIPGVKLLGRVSKKGHEYPPAVMAKALPLYAGMRVNVNHVDPGAVEDTTARKIPPATAPLTGRIRCFVK